IATFLFYIIPPHLIFTLFPYTTLFRSSALRSDARRTLQPNRYTPHMRSSTVSSISLLICLFSLAALATASAQLTPAYEPRPNERSEEHTSELQSRFDLVCRLLLEKKKI